MLPGLSNHWRPAKAVEFWRVVTLKFCTDGKYWMKSRQIYSEIYVQPLAPYILLLVNHVGCRDIFILTTFTSAFGSVIILVYNTISPFRSDVILLYSNVSLFRTDVAQKFRHKLSQLMALDKTLGCWIFFLFMMKAGEISSCIIRYFVIF